MREAAMSVAIALLTLWTVLAVWAAAMWIDTPADAGGARAERVFDA
jgi:hypothetical protein